MWEVVIAVYIQFELYYLQGVCVCPLYSTLWSPVQMKVINRKLSVESWGQETRMRKRRGNEEQIYIGGKAAAFTVRLIFQAVLLTKWGSCCSVYMCLCVPVCECTVTPIMLGNLLVAICPTVSSFRHNLFLVISLLLCLAPNSLISQTVEDCSVWISFKL